MRLSAYSCGILTKKPPEIKRVQMMEKGILLGLQKDIFSSSLPGLLLNSIAADAVKRWPENKNVREIRMINFTIMHFCSEFRIAASASTER